MGQKVEGWDLDSCPWASAESVLGPVLAVGQTWQDCLGL